MRIAILGYGRAGKRHAEIASARGHDVIVYDPNKVVTSHYQADTLEDALQADAVVVAVPVGYRDELADALLECNKPLMLEKPLALDPGVAFRYLDAAYAVFSGTAAQSRPIVLAENWTWSQWAQAPNKSMWVMAFSPISTEYIQPWVFDPKVGGGAFTEGGSHALTWWFTERKGLPFWPPDPAQVREYYRTLQYAFVASDPMRQGILTVRDKYGSTLVLAIDWSGQSAYGSGLCGFGSRGERLEADVSAHDDKGFDAEWDTFEAWIHGNLSDELLGPAYKTLAYKTLVGGVLTSQILWDAVLQGAR